MIVEAKDVKFYNVGETAGNPGRTVGIAGLVFHSSLAVDHIEQHKSGSDVILEVFLTMARSGLSGSFKVEVPVTDDIERILFGPTKTEIWPVNRAVEANTAG
jgi:hypothetical protein